MAAPGVAVPGSVVAIGSQASPAGPQGIQGPSAISTDANNKATLGSDSLVLVQGTAAGVAATTHAQTVSGDDPQLTNARTPSSTLAHQASHVTGTDQIPSASTAVRGLMPVANNVANNFYASDGTQKQVTYAALGGTQPAPVAHASSHTTGSDVIPAATSSAPGSVPATPNDSTKFLSGGATAAFSALPAAGPGVIGVAPTIDIQVFTTTGAGTWTKPTIGTPHLVKIICIGGGGGGGSGEYRAAGTACGGGGGGGGGSIQTVEVEASLLAATESVSVGPGGTGGASTTVAGNGANATGGTASWFHGSATTALCFASGGVAGGGGTAGAGGTGASNLVNNMYGLLGNDGAAGGSGAVGNPAPSVPGRLGAGSGGGGGGLAATQAALAGGGGSTTPNRANGGLAGAASGVGGSGTGSPLGTHWCGDGGGGGGSAITNVAKVNAGGAGGLYGGGGGGGGAAQSTTSTGSGAGGNGANGCIVVITFF